MKEHTWRFGFGNRNKKEDGVVISDIKIPNHIGKSLGLLRNLKPIFWLRQWQDWLETYGHIAENNFREANAA